MQRANFDAQPKADRLSARVADRSANVWPSRFAILILVQTSSVHRAVARLFGLLDAALRPMFQLSQYGVQWDMLEIPECVL